MNAPFDHGVVSVTELICDGARNVIPTTVILRGDVRGYCDVISQIVELRMSNIVSRVAAAHGVRSTLTYRREFRPSVNTSAETRRAARAAASIPDAVVDVRHAAAGFSEDFAQFLAMRPGCFMLMSNGAKGSHGASLHNPGYEFNDAVLPFGIANWEALVASELGR